jgi:hypothetical protein
MGPRGMSPTPLALAHWLADAFEARAVLELGSPREAVDAGAARFEPRQRIAAGAMPDGGWLERGA